MNAILLKFQQGTIAILQVLLLNGWQHKSRNSRKNLWEFSTKNYVCLFTFVCSEECLLWFSLSDFLWKIWRRLHRPNTTCYFHLAGAGHVTPYFTSGDRSVRKIVSITLLRYNYNDITITTHLKNNFMRASKRFSNICEVFRSLAVSVTSFFFIAIFRFLRSSRGHGYAASVAAVWCACSPHLWHLWLVFSVEGFLC